MDEHIRHCAIAGTPKKNFLDAFLYEQHWRFSLAFLVFGWRRFRVTNASILATVVRNSSRKEFEYYLLPHAIILAFVWAAELVFFRFLKIEFTSSKKYLIKETGGIPGRTRGRFENRPPGHGKKKTICRPPTTMIEALWSRMTIFTSWMKDLGYESSDTSTVKRMYMLQSVLPFWPNYRLAHPKNYLFLLSRKMFSGSKYPKNILFNFEKGSTGCNETATSMQNCSVPPTWVCRHCETW